MLDWWRMCVPVVDFGNNIRQVAKEEGVEDAFAFPGFVHAYIRPLFCRGVGPFCWVALSGDPEDIYKTDDAVKALLPTDAHLHDWRSEEHTSELQSLLRISYAVTCLNRK